MRAAATRLRDAGLRRRPRRRGADPVAAARPGRRQVRRLRRRDALHRRRARAGDPARGGGASTPSGSAAPASRHVHDLGCGIGADAMALAGLDLQVAAVDADELTAAIADGQPAALARRARPRSAGSRTSSAAATGEGARRVGRVARPGPADARGGRRPGPDQARLPPRRDLALVVDGAGRRPRRAGHRGQALARPSRTGRCPPGAEAQWTSYAGEVLECAVWWGPLAQRAGRSATVLRGGGAPAQRAVVTEADTLRAGADGRRRSPASGRGCTSPTGR